MVVRSAYLQEAGDGTDESRQEIVGGKQAGVAVQGDLGWRKLEERMEEMKCCLVRDCKGLKRVDW